MINSDSVVTAVVLLDSFKLNNPLELHVFICFLFKFVSKSNTYIQGKEEKILRKKKEKKQRTTEKVHQGKDENLKKNSEKIGGLCTHTVQKNVSALRTF